MTAITNQMEYGLRAPFPGKHQANFSVDHIKIAQEDQPDALSAGNGMNRMESLARFIGRSEAVLWMKRFIEKLAPLETTTLITGPSGSGKTLVAEIIHSLSKRSGKPFIQVNCASIPEETFELVLFGAGKDPSRGIEQDMRGKIELAQGGTLLLNKIGDMPNKVQKRLLGFAENNEIEKSGAKGQSSMDVRILATAKSNLRDLVNQGVFREDLFHRLNALSISVPPLIDRREDLPDLIQYLMARINQVLSTRISSISKGALGVLYSHDWPGNVRELQNVMEMAAILSDGSMISEQDVRKALRERFAATQSTTRDSVQIGLRLDERFCLKETLHEIEKKLILEALGKTGGVQVEAAKILALTPKNLWKKIRKHAIVIDQGRASESTISDQS
jgi:two-component system, NtrC family, response regulator AtoC